MPHFVVVFDQPVVYQPGHLKAQRTITELLVAAPDREGALQHAIRVTVGAAKVTVTEAA